MSSTLLILSDITVSKAPNVRATEIGILIHDGTLSLKNLMLKDFAPTYEIKSPQSHQIEAFSELILIKHNKLTCNVMDV